MLTSSNPGLPAASQADTFRSLLAMIAAITAGEGSLLGMPFIVGGIVERYGLTESASGFVIALQFVAMGAVSIILLGIVHRIDRRRLAVLSGIAMMIGHAIAIFADSWTMFLVGRVIAGLGEGAALSIGNAVAAGTRRPQRTFSILTLAMVATAVAIYLVMPPLAERIGPVSVFYVLLGLTALTFPVLFGIPNHVHAERDIPHLEASIWRPFPWMLVGIGGLYVAGNSLWAYSERIGKSIGMDVGAISRVFMATVVLAGIGAVLAQISERRWGNYWPILLGAVVVGVSNFVLSMASHPATFAGGIIVANIAFIFLVPYFRSLTAFLDPLGRLAVGSVVVQTVGTAIAPFAAGLMLLMGTGYAGIGVMAGVMMIMSFVLVAEVARRADATRVAAT